MTISSTVQNYYFNNGECVIRIGAYFYIYKFSKEERKVAVGILLDFKRKEQRVGGKNINYCESFI